LWRSRRAKPTSDDERLDVTAEVDRGGGVVDLVVDLCKEPAQAVAKPPGFRRYHASEAVIRMNSTNCCS